MTLIIESLFTCHFVVIETEIAEEHRKTKEAEQFECRQKQINVVAQRGMSCAVNLYDCRYALV